MYDENALANAESTILATLPYQDGPQEIILSEKLPNLVRGIIINALLIIGGLTILFFWDYSVDPNLVMFRYVSVVMLIALGVIGSLRLAKKTLDPDSRDSLKINAEGIFDNGSSMSWDKVEDIRIKKYKAKGTSIYVLMIMHKNDFLESQDITSLSILRPNEPEPLHDLRRVLAYYLNH